MKVSEIGNVVISDNDIGNNAHKKSDGKFTSKDAEGKQSDSKETSEEPIKEEADDDLFSAISDSDDDLFSSMDGSGGDDLNSFFNEMVMKETQLKADKTYSSKKSRIDSMDDISILSILSSFDWIDKKKISVLPSDKLKELLDAHIYVECFSDVVESDPELSQLCEQKFENIWMSPVSAKDYLEKSKKDTSGVSPIEKKLAYYQSNLEALGSINENNDENVNKISVFNDRISDLLKFEELGKQYAEICSKKNEKFANAKALLDSFEDITAPYSSLRKNNAVWVKTGGTSKSRTIFGSKAQSILNQMTKEQKQAVVDYTGSFSMLNEVLRGIKYTGYQGKDKNKFLKWCTDMTSAIDMSTYDFDYWVQRGLRQLQLPNMMLTSNISEKELKKLVGTNFIHPNFFSSGAAKGTGYDHNIILNTYCPKGTKGFYAEMVSHYSKGTENEMILQRGYEFRITKAEKVGSKIYLDIEAILKSDEKKYNYEELAELANKYL